MATEFPVPRRTLHWWVIRHLLLRTVQGGLLTLLFLVLLGLVASIPDGRISVGWHIAAFSAVVAPIAFTARLFIASLIRLIDAVLRWATGRPPHGRIRRRRDDDSGYDSVYLSEDGEATEDRRGGFFDDLFGGGGDGDSDGDGD